MLGQSPITNVMARLRVPVANRRLEEMIEQPSP
jgi:hypothetical protein